jgi:hypothetical protein
MRKSIGYFGIAASVVIAATLIGVSIANTDSTPHMTVTFTNATNEYIASLRVKDNGIGTAPLDQTSLSIGPQQGVRVSVIKDGKGKYDLTVTLRCSGQAGTRSYYDSVTTLKIEKNSDPVGCGVTSAKLK